MLKTGNARRGQAIEIALAVVQLPGNAAPRKTMSVARRCAIGRVPLLLAAGAASSFFKALSRARASRSASTAAAPASAA